MLDRLNTLSQTPIRPEDGRSKSGPRGPKVDFAASTDPRPERQAKLDSARQAATDAATGFPHLRRRTDLAETVQNAAGKSAIELPPHLERRRAWREAKGIGTFHAQNFAQNQDVQPDAEQRAAALGQYRQSGGRGRLDIDLAQHVSVTV